MNSIPPVGVLQPACRGLRILALAFLLVAHSAPAQPFPARIGDLDQDGLATVFDLVRLINYVNGDASVLPPGPGLTVQEREVFLDVDQNGLVDQRDADALADAILENRTLSGFPATRLSEASPAHGEEMVSPARTVIVRFSRRIRPATLNSNSLYLIANGSRVPGRIEVSSTANFATFFPASPFPASTEIRLVVDGSLMRDVYGLPVDTRSADGSSASAAAVSRLLADEPSALRGQFDFRTLPLFRIPGTHVWGYVFDSYNTNADGSLSVRSPRDTNAGPLLPPTRQRPIIGATIRVDAFPEANAVTDARGYFILTNMPAPEFFVHVDGTTASNAPPGTVYPSVGKPFHSIPGQSVQLLMGTNPFHVYLPPMSLGDVAPLNTNVLTDVFFGPDALAQLERMFPTNDPAMFQKVCVRYPPGSARDNLGRLATLGTIVPVPPNRIPAPLPPNLNPRLVISVQAMLPDGAAATRFDAPAPVIFPNLDGLAPGEKALFFSFNHAAGRWDVIGAGTATTNGTIETDSGVGIRALSQMNKRKTLALY